MSGGVGFDIFARDKTAQAFASVNNKVSGLNKKFDGLKRAVGGFGKMLAVGAIARFGAQIAENAAHLDDLSNRLGISAEALSRYQFIAERGGVEMDSLVNAMQKLGKNSIDAANGTGPAADALMRLGINAATFKNLGMDEQFALVAQKIQGIENPSERVKIAMELMGKSGAEMLQVMNQGGVSFGELKARADELGVTLRDTEANALGNMMDAFGDVGAAVKGLAQDFVIMLEPALTRIANFITYVVTKLNIFHGGITKLGLSFVGLANKVGIVSDEIFEAAQDEAFERINGDVKKTNQSLIDQDELLDKINGSVNRNARSYQNMKDKAKQGNKEIEESSKTLGDTWSDSIKNVSLEFDDLRGSALRAIQQIGEAMLKQVLNQQFGANPTSTGSGFNLGGVIGQLGDFFGGFFAEGGSFSSGKPIVVGEQGPEIIMPRRGGTVIPNDQIGGGRSTVVNVHISTPDAQSFKRSQSQIAAQMAQAVSQGNRNL